MRTHWIVFQLERELGVSIVRIVRTDAFGAYIWKLERCACKRIRLVISSLMLCLCLCLNLHSRVHSAPSMFRVCSVRIFGCECWSVLRLACLPQTFCACCRCSLCLLCVLRRALPFLCLLACCHCSLYLFCHFCVAPCLLACIGMNEW